MLYCSYRTPKKGGGQNDKKWFVYHGPTPSKFTSGLDKLCRKKIIVKKVGRPYFGGFSRTSLEKKNIVPVGGFSTQARIAFTHRKFPQLIISHMPLAERQSGQAFIIALPTVLNIRCSETCYRQTSLTHYTHWHSFNKAERRSETLSVAISTGKHGWEL